MNRFGIDVGLKNVPALDPDFMPLMRFNRAFLEGAKKARWHRRGAGRRPDGLLPYIYPRHSRNEGGRLLLHRTDFEDHPVDEGGLQGICQWKREHM